MTAANDSEKVNSSSVLWSQVVKETDPTEEVRPSYQFSNGRSFQEPKR